eukprot:gnl/TRDRNA2_/TRDRNA2_195616_c0_seq1.p1 gnl/TRDRNA2_/TRDRNA2_195616_c0~~gnl/TRDRNA2_/TRDRNA2_195616_c0_seq1.p1  ORF type:complete len:161 (-),score=25.00 gnl/TRDRNA2_/TRDRNA2_195616_c0_seq1:173-655(-)
MYTRRDYPVLNELVEEYGSEGLVVLGFPTAQFMNQEPGDEDEILHCLAHVRPGDGFVPKFPLMAKSQVNGKNAHALWPWLKNLCRLPSLFNYGAISWTPVDAHDIGWNFEKFLVGRDGQPCRRYDFSTPAADLHEDIAAVLRDGCPMVHEGCSVSGAMRR